MFFFTPRYLKHAKLLHKGVTRFIDYKRDLLPQAKLDEIITLRTSLEDSMKARDRERIKTLNDQLNKVCENALPNAGTSEISDNVEVFFVAIVIALGIRGYIAQPFQIPTGSMQPTLNGITAEATAQDPTPGIFGWLASHLTSTRYINVVSDHEGRLRQRDPLTEHRFAIFMPHCILHFEDGHEIKIPSPKTQLMNELQIFSHLNAKPILTGRETPDRRYMADLPGGLSVRKGQLLARGIVHNGDHVLVDKLSYHFRTPTRGEVFVFTTNHIRGINVPTEQGSQHYIKRLAGVPGDKLEVVSPRLMHDGKVAEEAGFKRVMQGSYEAPVDGYRGYADANSVGGSINRIDLSEEQYFAMGDNSYNSSDSRVWGAVPERNIVGTALICYWPLTKHWGWIK